MMENRLKSALRYRFTDRADAWRGTNQPLPRHNRDLPIPGFSRQNDPRQKHHMMRDQHSR
jgi:hypothetical protein